MPFKNSILIVLVGILLSGMCLADDYRIDRLEPPFWWQRFKHTELQLMVYGPGIAEFTPSIEYPGLSIRISAPAPGREALTSASVTIPM
jgi:hypothetical protein